LRISTMLTFSQQVGTTKILWKLVQRPVTFPKFSEQMKGFVCLPLWVQQKFLCPPHKMNFSKLFPDHEDCEVNCREWLRHGFL
jgi:hypothetical protein